MYDHTKERQIDMAAELNILNKLKIFMGSFGKYRKKSLR